MLRYVDELAWSDSDNKSIREVALNFPTRAGFGNKDSLQVFITLFLLSVNTDYVAKQHTYFIEQKNTESQLYFFTTNSKNLLKVIRYQNDVKITNMLQFGFSLS